MEQKSAEKVKQAMEIEEVEFESLEGCNEAFKKMTMGGCCGTQGGMMCGCGPKH